MHSMMPTGSREGQQSCKHWLWLWATKSDGRQKKDWIRRLGRPLTLVLLDEQVLEMINDMASSLGGCITNLVAAPHESNAWFFSHVGKGYCTDDTSPHARMRTFFSLRVTLRTIHPMHLHWLKMFERFSVCVSKIIPSAHRVFPGCS